MNKQKQGWWLLDFHAAAESFPNANPLPIYAQLNWTQGCFGGNILLGLRKVTVSVCDPCLFPATQQCSPYSSAGMLLVLKVRPVPAGSAVDHLAGWELLSADGWHAAPLYQANARTGGFASLVQVRVTGSLPPTGETETAVSRGESRRQRHGATRGSVKLSHTFLVVPPANGSLTLHVDVQNRGVLRLVSSPCLTDVASGVSRSGLADVPHLTGMSWADSCALEPGVIDPLPSCRAAAGQP